MITEDYVSLKVAKLLKEKVFNEPCRLYYDKYHGYVPIFVEDSKLTEYGYKERVRNDQNSISDFIASAPSLYVAMKWLREVHKLYVSVIPNPLNYEHQDIQDGWACEVTHLSDLSYDSDYEFFQKKYQTYESACEAAIKYCLENLI